MWPRAEQACASVSSDAEGTIIDPICSNKDTHTAVPHFVLDDRTYYYLLKYVEKPKVNIKY